MLPTGREEKREKLLAMLTAHGRSRAEGAELAAKLLHVSVHTVIAWTRPATNRSSNEIPLMALELLMLKMAPKRKARLQ